MKLDIRTQLLFGLVLSEEHQDDLNSVLDAMLDADVDPAAVAFTLSGFLSPERQQSILIKLAHHRSGAVREHFFALLGKHRRLVPPGSIRYESYSSEVLTSVLAAGLEDENPRVRERAIAATYGLGLVEGLRTWILALATDEDSAVRQYAIVALGVLRDADSRMLLLSRLHNGTEEETISAIWALARRPDGIQDVLELAGDERGWINVQVLDAFAEVATALNDETIADLERKIPSPEFARLRARHIDRTRHGARETGPDARIEIVKRGATS
jgi:HEAT repeat protein